MLLAVVLAMCAKKKQLVILHTNDTHSTIFPLNPNLSDTTKADRGGFIRRIAMLKAERQKDIELHIDEARLQLKYREDEPDIYVISGWSIAKGADNAAFERKLILEGDAGRFEAELVNRYSPDIRQVFYREINTGLSGFAVRIRAGVLPVGEYRIGIVYTDKRNGKKYSGWQNSKVLGVKIG